MLYIYVNKKQIDLPPDIQLNFINENPLFLDDRIPAPYTLSGELPLSRNNLQTFGYINRMGVNMAGDKADRFPAYVKYDSMLIAAGELIILSIQKNIRFQFKGSLETANVSKDLSAFVEGEYDYGEFPQYGEEINYNNGNFDSYIQNMLNNSTNAGPYAIAPVRIAGKVWEGGDAANGIRNAYGQYINYFNPVTKTFAVADPEKIHSPIIPFPYIKQIINNAFGQFLQQNPFEQDDLAKLLLVSQHHKYNSFDNLNKWYWEWNPNSFEDEVRLVLQPLVDNYADQGNLNIDLAWKMKSFMPNYPFNSLLKNLMKIFGMSAFPGPVWSIEYNSNTIARNSVLNWDKYLIGIYEKNIETGKNLHFKYSKTSDTEESYLSMNDSILELYNDAMSGMADTARDLYDNDSTAAYTITKIIRGMANLPVLNCSVKKTAFASKKDNPDNLELTEVSSDVSPCDMVIDKYWWMDKNPPHPHDIIPFRHWYVPQIEEKSLSDAPNIMFWGGREATFYEGDEYPTLMNHHTNHLGVKKLNTSLCPDVSQGLNEKYHAPMREWHAKNKTKITANFRITPDKLFAIDIRDKIWVRNKLFFIKKLTYTVTHTKVSTVEAELIEV